MPAPDIPLKISSRPVGWAKTQPSSGGNQEMESPMPDPGHELTLTRLLDAPRGALYRCWTEPDLLKQWFAPRPYTTPVAEIDLRPGGASKIVMRSPDGREMPNPGQYLEVVPGRKLVFSDAFTGDWRPKEDAPFMVAVIEFADEGGKTRYTATVRHWSEADKKRHEEMGFHQGWGICAEQLEALAKSL
jgi:uncharacterized protein YndB with AHSA1/START domain